MTEPIPVPSECFDFTPVALWSVIRAHYPDGIEMPPTVPKHIWDKHWRKRYSERDQAGEEPPPPPILLKGYWGRFKGRALEPRRLSKKQTSTDGDADSMPQTFPPRLSNAFWQQYFELFPDGHRAPTQGRFTPAAKSDGKVADRYTLKGGSLYVNTSKYGIDWRPSTGVDTWDREGNWTGPG